MSRLYVVSCGGFKNSYAMTEQSTGYTASIYKEIKKDEQQARVQNIFYELRAEGYDANEAAVLALERARGGDEEM